MAASRQLFLQKSSIVDVWLGSKYTSVNITLHLTFLRKTLMMKIDEKETPTHFPLRNPKFLGMHFS